MRRPVSLAALTLLASIPLFGVAFADVGADAVVRLNQIQVIGSHNSYHSGLTPGVAKMLKAINPKAYDELDYRHAGLSIQLDHGVRQLELDIYSDAEGGRFAHPYGATLNAGGAAAFDPTGVMKAPGFKVMHVQDIDYVSNCQPFVACLNEIRTWSQAHPRHVPVFILVETKTQPPIKGVPGMATPEPFTTKVLDALDAEIRSVFSADEMIVPDSVRGARKTLMDAALHGGWPTLAASRGKVMFLLDQTNVTQAYLADHPSLRGRVLFTNAHPGDPDAAFVEENDGAPGVIAALVRQGYLVRTRSDTDTKEARTGDVTQRDNALRSGAQIVSTDYPGFEPSPWTPYAVSLPGDIAARCNPVNGPKGCADAAISGAAAKP